MVKRYAACYRYLPLDVAMARTLSTANSHRWEAVDVVVEAVAAISTEIIALGQENPVKYGRE